MHWRLFAVLLTIGFIPGWWLGSAHNPCYQQIQEYREKWNDPVDSIEDNGRLTLTREASTDHIDTSKGHTHAMKIIIHSNRDLVREYVERGHSVKQIADKIGISKTRVYQLIKAMGLELPREKKKRLNQENKGV